MKNLLTITIIFLSILLLAFIVSMGLDKQAIVSCNVHAERLTTMQDYYLTNSELDMCLSLDSFQFSEDDFKKIGDNFYLLNN